ncbi:MAG: hypothetical protein J5I62_09120 [Flavobacteriales bacterium]|nr:hypothetical protein [Flavobacteriales bacterium]MEB2342362.1 hypothetical protein [Flavobacteriia bacterium]
MGNTFLLACLAALLMPACGRHAASDPGSGRATADVRMPHPPSDPMAFDVEQHTCALYVALHSHALESSISFGRDLQQVDVHWNVCPGGTMVACATAPGPNGSVVVSGIPWPYGAVTKH